MTKPVRTELAESLANALRLKRDAAFLGKNRRPKSGDLTVVLALEELGKYLILRLNTKNKGNKRKFPSHIEKQSAVFCLLFAGEAVDPTNLGPLAERMKKKGELDLLKEGPMARQLVWARAGFYEDLKQSAAYSDDDPKIPKKLSKRYSRALVDDLIHFFNQALILTKNDRAMQLAPVVYQNDLGRM